jgi:hypothetical protein
MSPSDAMAPGPVVDAPLDGRFDAPIDASLPVTQGLLARFAFDQAPTGGTRLSDGLGNSADLKGTVAFADDRPPTASAGRSLVFDGTTTFADVTLAPASQPNSTGPKSVAMWIKATDPGSAKHTIIAMFNRSKAATSACKSASAPPTWWPGAMAARSTTCRSPPRETSGTTSS